MRNRIASNPENYVFPILEHGISADEELRRVRNLTRSINTYIKKIARVVGIEKEVITYTARHSFSTVLKRSAAPTYYWTCVTGAVFKSHEFRELHESKFV